MQELYERLVEAERQRAEAEKARGDDLRLPWRWRQERRVSCQASWRARLLSTLAKNATKHTLAKHA